jgi:hypothetical protein
MSDLKYFWDLQNRIENKFKKQFNKKYSIQLEYKQTTSTSFYEIIMQRFFFEILTLIITLSFWYFYFKSLSFNTFDALFIIWFINAPLWTLGFIIFMFIDIYKFIKFKENYDLLFDLLYL